MRTLVKSSHVDDGVHELSINKMEMLDTVNNNNG